jgi:uncharacterized protein (TIRG00374 family)
MQFFKTIFKVILSLGLLVYLVYEAGPEKILSVFSNMQATGGFGQIALAFGFLLLSLLFLTLRWHELLKWYGAKLRFPRLYGFYLIGMFFNNFLPTSIGGDIYRIYKVIDDANDRTISFASVIIERIMGVAATLFLAIIALFFISQQYRSLRLLILAAGLFIGIFLFFFILIRNRPFLWLLSMFERFTIFKIGAKFNKLFEAIHGFRNRRRVLVIVFFYSLLSQVAIVMMNYSLVKAFALQIDVRYLFIVIPITIVMTMLPSINGIGVRDLGFIGLLNRVGISNAAALSLSFMNLLLPMLVSVWGAILFMMQKHKSVAGEADAVESEL